MNNDKILEIKDLNISYRQKQAAVSGLSLSIRRGEILTIVGESGSGKSSLIHAVLGLLSSSVKISGTIVYKDKYVLNDFDDKLRKEISGKEIAMVFQDTLSHLDPIKRISYQYDEFITAHEKLTKEECRKLERESLKKLGFEDPDRILDSYPFELSGGMQQRVGIAMALTFNPALLLADEPTSALDVTLQVQVVEELLRLSEDHNTAMIIVTHNMGVAAHISDNIAVMKDGRMVEYGSKEEVIENPKSEYTKKLIEAIPKLDDLRFADRKREVF